MRKVIAAINPDFDTCDFKNPWQTRITDFLVVGATTLFSNIFFSCYFTASSSSTSRIFGGIFLFYAFITFTAFSLISSLPKCSFSPFLQVAG
jgi:hypothetical protein